MSETNPQAELYARIAEATQGSGPMYWPGKDYPDREVWLAKREAQRAKPQARVVYAGRQPLALGLNNVKRRADTSEDPTRERRNIVKHRHDYYRDRYERSHETHPHMD